ncbi:DUF4189 domain-containing protein [Nocardia sp. NPDC127579]|uniref:DUF4189 domain-containing protein n=1 Tax=Nocardia sp. NPDC127579 TaxID=3345402 RepID=UPI00362557E4
MGRTALAMVLPAMGALLATSAGPAQAAGDLYGAMAVSREVFRKTVAVDYPTQAAAEQAALEACGANCFVYLVTHNECGSLVQRVSWNHLFQTFMPSTYTGTGPTAAAAERAAMESAGPDVDPLMDLIVVTTQPARVEDTFCTANTG